MHEERTYKPSSPLKWLCSIDLYFQSKLCWSHLTLAAHVDISDLVTNYACIHTANLNTIISTWYFKRLWKCNVMTVLLPFHFLSITNDPKPYKSAMSWLLLPFLFLSITIGPKPDKSATSLSTVLLPLHFLSITNGPKSIIIGPITCLN